MSTAYLVAIDGLDLIDDFDNVAPQIAKYARMAINRVARDRRSSAAREIRQQVSFPARYISGQSGRLSISRYADERNLSATITGRDRPTSLARFASSRNPAASRRKGGVSVTVSPGETKFMKGAFIMELRGGNLGLAVRLKNGESLRNKREARQVSKGLYLLYGPSVNQVFRGVAEDGTNETADALQREFLRLMEM